MQQDDVRGMPRSLWFGTATAAVRFLSHRRSPQPTLTLLGGLALLLAVTGAFLAFRRVPGLPRPLAAVRTPVTGAALAEPTAPATASSAPPTVLPSASAAEALAPTAAPAPPVTIMALPVPRRTYVVQPGDSLTLLAERFSVSLPTLAHANDLAPTAYLLIGQMLQLPSQPLVPVLHATFAGLRDAARVGATGVALAVVPVTARTTAPTAPAAATPGSYVVQPGDSLTLLAARFGLSLAALAQANALPPTAALLIGQVLTIPGAALPSAPPRPPSGAPAQAPPPAPFRYTVQAGDSLTLLAERFGLSLAALAQANDLSPAAGLLVGQVLVIP